MQNSIFLIGLAVSIAYLLFKFIEMRFVLKENKPLKLLARDTLLVYLSVLLGNFIIAQMGGLDISRAPEVFTNSPGF
tara:strand:- start:224 stop:454 length:231 start_codon:yes stop_codon:yes gene_type:complete